MGVSAVQVASKRFCNIEYGFLFSESIVASPASDERRLNTQSFAEIGRRFVNWQLGDRNPQVQLVALGAAFEATKRVLCQVGGKRSAAGRCRPVNRTRAAQLITSLLGRLESNEFQNLADADSSTHFGKIDSRHRIALNREEESVFEPFGFVRL